MECEKEKVGTQDKLRGNLTFHSVLHLVGVVSLLQGVVYIVVAYIDNTITVLPRDPLTIIGIVSIEAGVIFLTTGLIFERLRGTGPAQSKAVKSVPSQPNVDKKETKDDNEMETKDDDEMKTTDENLEIKDAMIEENIEITEDKKEK